MAAGLELVQDAAELWGSAGRIRILCKEILQLLDHECVESEEVEDYANEGSSSVTRIFREIWELARDILSSEEAANECMEVIHLGQNGCRLAAGASFVPHGELKSSWGPGVPWKCFRVQTLKQLRRMRLEL